MSCNDSFSFLYNGKIDDDYGINFLFLRGLSILIFCLMNVEVLCVGVYLN